MSASRIFFLTESNELVGTKEKRAPRKAKKAMKRLGYWEQFTALKGFNINLLQQ